MKVLAMLGSGLLAAASLATPGTVAAQRYGYHHGYGGYHHGGYRRYGHGYRYRRYGYHRHYWHGHHDYYRRGYRYR